MKELPLHHDVDPEIKKVLEGVWIEFYGYPLQMSIDASKLEGDIGKEHQGRLRYFYNYICEQESTLGELPVQEP